MPVERAEENGKPGFRYGDGGKIYTYTPGNEDSMNEAKRKAHVQGYAIQKSQEREGASN